MQIIRPGTISNSEAPKSLPASMALRNSHGDSKAIKKCGPHKCGRKLHTALRGPSATGARWFVFSSFSIQSLRLLIAVEI